MNIINSRLAKFIECIEIKPSDRLLSFWLKRGMWITTAGSFFYAYFIGAYRSMFLLGLLFFFWTLDCTFTREKIYFYFDIGCMTMVTAAVCTIVISGEMGQFGVFMSLVIAIMAILILGLIWGTFFAFINCVFTIAIFAMGTTDMIGGVYPKVFQERYPYMMVCFITVTLIIQYEIQSYWDTKKNYKSELESLIKKGESERTDVFLNTLSTMNSALSARMPGIEQHCNATAEWARDIAIEMGIKYPEARRYYYAGLLHDIGKIGLPDSFWEKEKLSKEEIEKYNSHVDIGAQIVRGMQIDIITDGALYHHERMDGKGYKGLKGNEIPLSAKVVAVAARLAKCESLDKPSEEMIYELKKDSGEAFDGVVVDAAICIIKDREKKAEEDKIFS